MTGFRHFLVMLTITLVISPAVVSQQTLKSVSVGMTSAQQEKMGVGVTPLPATGLPASSPAYATVIDVSPLAALTSEIATARAAAAAARAEADRLARLAAQDQSASRQAVEAAEATAKADETRIALAQRRVGLEWGPVFARMSWDDLNRLLGQIARGEAALVRIDGAGATGTLPKHARLRDRNGAFLAAVTIIGIAATSDPRFQTAGLLALAKGPVAANLRPGGVLSADLAGDATIAGVVLPRSALVRMNAATWAYVRVSKESFERRPVTGARQIEQGWFVTQGFAPGEEVATAGAGALIAAEHADPAKGAEKGAD